MPSCAWTTPSGASPRACNTEAASGASAPSGGFLLGESDESKSTQGTVGQLREGMPWKALLISMTQPPHQWWMGLQADLDTIGVSAAHRYMVPSARAVLVDRNPPGATNYEEATAFIRAVAAKCSIQQAHRIKGHTAKQSAMRVVNCFTDEGAPTDTEKDILAHHRASGPDKTARAYNPDELHAPAAKWTHILTQWTGGAYTLPPEAGGQWQPAQLVDVVSPELATEVDRAEGTQPDNRRAHEPDDYDSVHERDQAAKAAAAVQERLAAQLRAVARGAGAQEHPVDRMIQGYLTARIRKGRSDYFHLMVRQQGTLNTPFRASVRERVRITVDGEVLEVLCDWPLTDRPT